MDKLETFLTETLAHGCKKIIVGIVIIAVGFWITKFLVNRFKNSRFNSKIDEAAKFYIEKAISIIFRCIVIISAVGYLGVPLASITAAVGSVGLALGLALQGGLSNIAGGIILIFTHPFKIGDYVSIDKLTGTVEVINIYYTEIITPDNQKILIPNGTAANSEIINYSVKESRRLCIEFTVAYNTDIEKAKAVMIDEAKNNSCVLEIPEPVVLTKKHADSSIILMLQVWTKNEDYMETNSKLLEAVKEKFDAQKIEIPYPQMDIHIK